MNWKQFLKPDWKKIILSIILLIIGLVTYFTPSLRIVSISISFPILIGNYIGGPQIVSLLNIAKETKSIFLLLLILIILLLVLLIYWYLISCLIVWIYEKIRGKKKHKKSKLHINFNSGWRKFFKPDWRKIILFIILLLIEGLVIYFKISYIGQIIFYSIPFFIALFSENKIFILFTISIPIIGLLFLIGNFYFLSIITYLIYLYFISCMIISFYDVT